VKFKTLDNQNQPFRKVSYQELRVKNLEKLKACKRGDQCLGEAQDLQQMGPTPWHRSATKGTSTMEKLKLCKRGG
jgi:hypothetical protein